MTRRSRYVPPPGHAPRRDVRFPRLEQRAADAGVRSRDVAIAVVAFAVWFVVGLVVAGGAP